MLCLLFQLWVGGKMLCQTFIRPHYPHTEIIFRMIWGRGFALAMAANGASTEVALVPPYSQFCHIKTLESILADNIGVEFGSSEYLVVLDYF